MLHIVLWMSRRVIQRNDWILKLQALHIYKLNTIIFDTQFALQTEHIVDGSSKFQEGHNKQLHATEKIKKGCEMSKNRLKFPIIACTIKSHCCTEQKSPEKQCFELAHLQIA